jgi:diadenosine tetraphosphate (Ap4A) HIT family hydrolase
MSPISSGSGKKATALAEVLKDSFGADKLNVAALGNVVSQLHACDRAQA